ncbi:hypothetical protein H5185_12190 [Shewanella sp. SG44-6]|jgi:hypothetical protein|uniref:hypothetical protein n=1 Tax=Shewanella sp. SG44-6 TaxID=2760959 RepID=UPI0016018C1E|nr:hypothetical protein [Shewanella sp. SG44-6]MBB1390173.1 hypothetical protein [Shewanella sp. SG44-6]
MKTKSLGKSFGNAILINAHGKACEHQLSDADLDAIQSMFSKKKWISSFRNVINQTVSFHSRKKRDLGTDSLLLKIVGSKYIIATTTFSDSNKTENEYFEIII